MVAYFICELFCQSLLVDQNFLIYFSGQISRMVVKITSNKDLKFLTFYRTLFNFVNAKSFVHFKPNLETQMP